MAEKSNAVLVHRTVEAIWNRGQLDLTDGLFAADCVNHADLIPDLVCGPEAIKISVALYRIGVPDLQITVDKLTAKRILSCSAGPPGFRRVCLHSSV